MISVPFSCFFFLGILVINFKVNVSGYFNLSSRLYFKRTQCPKSTDIPGKDRAKQFVDCISALHKTPSRVAGDVRERGTMYLAKPDSRRLSDGVCVRRSD